ncbi:MAG TPA: VTT domain-containing protein [Methanobacterium sp.]|nr:VTT domain-containing protein [Methanobacterium sp.]
MFEQIILYLEGILLAYGALGVFIGSIVEEIIAPIPSTLIIMGTSFILLKGVAITPETLFTLFMFVVLPASIGVTIGSSAIYILAYYIGKEFVDRWGKYLGISWGSLEKAQKKFENSRSDEILLFLVRAIPVVPSIAINVFCGFIRYDLKKFLVITFLGTMVRAFILGFLGWQFGSFYQSISTEISGLEEISLAVIILVIIIYIGYMKYGKK